jgi:hypothetical protein
MRERTGCAACGIDANKYGFPRTLNWDGVRFVFCSYLCEFLWRRKGLANKTLGPVASESAPNPE